MAADRDDLKTIWQTQHVEAKPMSIDQIRNRANNFRETARNRNIVEYLAAAYVAGSSAWQAWTAHSPWSRLGFVLLLLGTLTVAYQLRRRASARRISSQLPAADYLAAYRDELRRQQDALRNVAAWYLAPFLPGLAVILIARTLEHHPAQWLQALFLAAAMAILYGGIWMVNVTTASSMQRDIDDVDSMLSSNG